MKEDAKNHYAATLARVHGVRFTIAVVHDTISTQGLRALGRRRDDQPASGDRGGDRPVRARPAHAAGRDARGRPLRGARHHDEADERVRRPAIPRHADPRRADRRDRAGRSRRLPAQRRGAAGRRPRDRLHRDVAGRRTSSASCDGRARRARIGDRATWASTSPGALALTGMMLTYLSADARSCRLRSRSDTARRSGPSSSRAAIAGAVGLGLMRLGRRSPGPIGFREGYLVVSLTWLLAAVFAGLPYLFSGEPQLVRPGRRALRGDVRASRRPARRSSRTSRASTARSSSGGS